jgi:hypothetical protein
MTALDPSGRPNALAAKAPAASGKMLLVKI